MGWDCGSCHGTCEQLHNKRDGDGNVLGFTSEHIGTLRHIAREVLEAFLIYSLGNLRVSALSLGLIDDEFAYLEECLK